MKHRGSGGGWLRPAAILILIAALIGFAMREALTASSDRLPGTDAAIHYAWEVFTRAALARGQLPHWNPYQYSGMPHLADSQMLVFYPPALLLRWLSPERFLTWLAALHLLIAAAGGVFLSRVLGLGWLPSGIVATALALGGSVGGWLHAGHLLILNCVAWLPWALGASVLTARRKSLLPHPALPIVLVLQVLAGYPQGALYITAAVALYFAYSAIWPDGGSGARRRLVALGQLAVVGVLSAGLAAFQLLPTLQLAAHAARTSGLSYEDATRGAWSLRDLASFFSPEPAAPDGAAYVGWLLAGAAVLALFDRSRRRTVVFFAALTVLAVAVAFGDSLPLYRLHYATFPGFRIPTRALFVATLGMAVLGAIGLALVADSGARLLRARTSLKRAVLAMAWVAIAAELTGFAASGVQTVPADTAETVRGWVGGPDGGRALTLCEQKVGRSALSLAGVPSVGGPLGMNLRDYVEWLNVLESPDRPSDIVGRFPIRRDLLDASNVTTVVSCEPLEGPALTLASHVDSVRVYRNEAAWPRAIWTCETKPVSRSDARFALLFGRYVAPGRLLREAIVSVRWSAAVADDRRVQLESRYALAEGSHREGSTWRYVLRDVNAANIAALIRDPLVEDTHGIDRRSGVIADDAARQAPVDTPGGSSDIVIGGTPCEVRGEVTVRMLDRADGRVVADVEAPVSGLVFFSEPYYPERAAFVDGRHVTATKANLAFTAVPVPAGRHTVELAMVPRTFHAGLGLSATTLGIWVAAAAWLSHRRRRAWRASDGLRTTPRVTRVDDAV